MKKITVDAKAFAEAMNKVSRVLKRVRSPYWRRSPSASRTDAARWPQQTWTHGSQQSFRLKAMIYPSFSEDKGCNESLRPFRGGIGTYP